MRFLTRAFAVIGFLVVLAIGIGIIARIYMHRSQPVMPEKAVLTLNIEGEFQEKPGFDPFEMNHQMALIEAVKAIDAAAEDKHIKGLFVDFSANLPLTQAQELRTAVEKFRAHKKIAFAFADTFGEQDTGAAAYYLATGFDKIWLQPMGMVGLMGVGTDEFFLKDALAHYGVMLQANKREQYKTAFDNFTENGFTPANREMLKSIIDDMVGQLTTGIAEGRRLDPKLVRDTMDAGPISADDAKKIGLIDEVDYRDEALDELQDETDTDDTISARRFLGLHKDKPAKAKIALIYTVGELSRETDDNPLSDDTTSDPREVLAAFRQASDDPDIKAIVFRINSPGGSVVASETIRNGVLLARDADKPVIVSMGEVAGSGGYWIAADADKIIAEPATLTGSIGVLGGKPVVQKFLADHDIKTDFIANGQNAVMDSPFRPFTPEQEAKENAELDDIYTHFKGVVAEGRGLSPARVEEIAKGRVYTAAQAKDLGLIDELGGIKTAIDRAKEAAGLTASTVVEIDEIPGEPTPAEFLRSFFTGDDEDDDILAHTRLAASMRAWARLKAMVAPLIETPGNQTVRMQVQPLQP
jgi:protease-4